MQTATATGHVTSPGTLPSPAGPQRAEFRFASEEALDRALGLVREQGWIASCAVDRARRTLRVVLSAGTPRTGRSPACPGTAAFTLH